MKIAGCDLHTRYQQIAMLDAETGELVKRRLEHESREARAFYAGLAGPVRGGSKPPDTRAGSNGCCRVEPRALDRGRRVAHISGATEHYPRRPIGATAWTTAKDREYDDQDEHKKDSQPESLAKILLERMGLANVKPKPPSEEDEGDQEEELSEPDTSFT